MKDNRNKRHNAPKNW